MNMAGDDGLDTDKMQARLVNLSEQLADEELIELLADKEHASWSHWMNYLFSRCTSTTHGDAVIPMELALRWRVQADTPYERLSEQEKQSDRDEVAKILPIIHEHFYPRELLLAELKQWIREALALMGNEQQMLGAYRRARDELERRVRALLGDAHVGGKDES